MKKWFIALAALALLLMQSTAMAFYKDAICPKCKVEREFVRTDDYCWIPKEDMHMRVYRCPVCDRRQGMGKMSPHEESKPATCVSGAYCALCKTYRAATNPNNHTYTIVYNKVDEYNHLKKEECSGCKKLNTSLTEQHRQKQAATCVSGAICADCGEAYGSPNPDAHNWTEWQPHMTLPNVHYRYCQNPGCRKYETEPHDGNSNCVTSATCSKCKATYKDTTKHKGPLTYKYEKENENFHKKFESCDACGKRTGSFVSTQHVEQSPANCTHAAVCKDCQQEYGGKNLNNHNWSDWMGLEDLKHHYRQCCNNESHYEEEEHTGGSATCSTMGNCSACNAFYYNSDVHEGTTTTTYTFTDTQHTPTTTYSDCKHSVTGEPEAHEATIPATCSKAAYCGICKQFFGSTDQTNHSWVAATCLRAEYCSDCQTERGEKDPTNHVGATTTKYEKTSETQHTAKITYADCKHTVDGESTDHTETTAAYCRVCKDNYGSTDPNAHNLVQHDAKAPTCTEIGWDAYDTCTRCSYTTYVEKPKQGHKLVYHSGRAPTCTTIGWSPYYTCARCDYTTYNPKGILGHDPVNHSAKAPTCTEIGWDAYDTCSRCDYTTYVEKKALGHDLVNHAAKAPTCTTIGWNAYDTCSRCDYTTYVEKSALRHDRVSHAAKAPTCTEIGWSAYDTCSRCDYSTYVEKSALGHALVNHAAKAPTCTGIGWDAYQTCSRCDYSTYAELPALGHDYAAKTTRPTCTERGYTTHTCARCKDSYRDAYVSALGHRYGEWIPNADGSNASACLRDCGDVRTADCAPFVYALPAGDVRMELTLCPVCGEIREIRLLDAEGKLIETLDGAVLLLIEDATAEALTEALPEGTLVVRMGSLPNGKQLLSVAFELNGALTQPGGQIKISLPAGVLEGHTLVLLDEDGTEAPIDLEIEEGTASFTLDFSDSLSPACLIRLVPEA